MHFGLRNLRLGLRGLVLALPLLAGVSTAQGAEAETVIVTASRLEVSRNQDVLILAQDDLSLDVLDSLGRQPSVIAFSNGGAGGSSYLSIRGGEPNFTLVLFDGIRLNDSTNSAGGGFDFNQIEPAFIDRIEIDRSTGSAIHGSDALSGVVNVVSASPDAALGSSAQIKASVQTEGGYSLSGLAGHTGQSGDFQFGLARRDSGALSENSNLRRNAALIRLNQSLGAGLLGVTAYHAETDRSAYAEDSGGDISSVGPVLEDRDTKLSLLGLRYTRPLIGETNLHTTLNFSEQISFSDIPAIPGGVFDGVPARIDETQLHGWEGLAYLRAAILPEWHVAIGGGYVNESGRGEGILDIGFPLETNFSERREILSAFAETFLSVSPDLDFEGAVRLDNPEGHSSELTYKSIARYRPLDDFELHIGHSTSFKLPSIFATSYPLIANPDLEPEVSDSFEGGFSYVGDFIGQFSLTAHETKFRNLVDFDPEAFTNVNRQEVSSQGIEIRWAKAFTEDLDVRTSIAFADIETSADQSLRNRPEVSAAANVEYQFAQNVKGYVSWLYSSERFSSSVPTGFVTLEGYNLFDFSVSWAPSKNWELGLELRNGFDADYSQAVGVRELERHLTLSVNRSL